jgi:hypothetical protein
MTSGPDPLWVIYGGPFTPWIAKLAASWPELGHLWLWGWTPLPAVAHDRLIAHVPSGGPIVMLDPMAR